MIEKSVQELAVFLQGKVENDAPDLVLTGVSDLVTAGPQDVSFAVPPYVERCHESKAGALVIGLEDRPKTRRPLIRVANPRAAFAALLGLFRPPLEIERVVSPLAYVSPTAVLGKNVAVQAFAFIEAGAEIGDDCVIYPSVYVGRNVKIGAGSTLYPNVTIREDCVIGRRVILQAGAVIGGDGFGYTNEADGSHKKILQTGNVIIEDDVEIGNNSCVDRATTKSTVVGRGSKLDNLVHLAHNDIVGKNCLFCGHVGISGSVTIGDNCVFAGQAATVGHITIGDNCIFGGRTGIIGNIPANSQMAGFPAQPYKEWLRHEASLRKVGELLKRVKELEKEVERLKGSKAKI